MNRKNTLNKNLKLNLILLLVEYSGPEIKESTLREIFIMKLIGGHPNIIDIHDTFESDSFVFIVMELYDLF